jgi:hypothetical protein
MRYEEPSIVRPIGLGSNMSDNDKIGEPHLEIVFDRASVDFDWAIGALKTAYWASARPDASTGAPSKIQCAWRHC